MYGHRALAFCFVACAACGSPPTAARDAGPNGTPDAGRALDVVQRFRADFEDRWLVPHGDGGEPACLPLSGTAPPIPFENVPASESGIDFVHHVVTDFCDVRDVIGPGACLLDLEGDGDLDAYFVDRAPFANRLYRNDGRARFTEVPDAAGAADTSDGMGCLAFDYDLDGDSDLYVSNLGADRLYRNEGGVFTDVTAIVGLATTGFGASAAAADIDGDGDLDLYVGRFLDPASCPPECEVDIRACNPQSSYLFENRAGTYVDVTRERGIVAVEPSLAVRFHDFDLDGDADLYVGNDIGDRYPDRVYVNDGTGHFVDRAPEFGLDRDSTGDSGYTMGVDLGDVDYDGTPDLVSSNATGRPVLFYSCASGPLCHEESTLRGLDSTRLFNWAVLLEDFDQDDDLDLFVSNGHIYRPAGIRNQLFWNEGGTFVEYAPGEAEGLSFAQSSRAALPGDLDGDGDLDVLVANVAVRPQLLRNVGTRGHWLAVRVEPRTIGTRVTLTRLRVGEPARSLTRYVYAGGSFLGSGTGDVHFGLGDSCTADVRVEWPDGTVVTRTAVRADQLVEVSP